MLRALPLALMVLIPASCSRPRADTPVDAYLGFVRAAQKGDEKAAYAALSEPSQQALAARARQVSEASGAAIKPDAAGMFLAVGPRAPAPTKVELVRQEGTTAHLQVTVDAHATEVAMVKEPSGWKLDLTGTLKR